MTKYVSLFIFLIASNYANAQNEAFPKPKTESIVYHISDKKLGIRYYFPKSVSNLLDSICIGMLAKNKKTDFFIEMVSMGDTVNLYGHRIINGFKALRRDDKLSLLLKATHCYVLINNNKVPLYFDTDIKFGFPSFAFSGSSFYIQFVGRKFEKGTIIAREY